MARLRFVVEIESIGRASAASGDLFNCIADSIGERWYREFSSAGLSVTAIKPDTVGVHGEHRMVNGSYYVRYADLYKYAGVGTVGMDDAGSASLRKPEERPATCACYVGAGAKPYAHEPSCPVHPRYIDTGLPNADRPAKVIREPLLDNAEQDGEKQDAKAEHAGTSSPPETWTRANGSVYSGSELK